MKALSSKHAVTRRRLRFALLDGRLIRIYSWPGMKQTDEGLAVIGRTESMQVWAQVFQTDVSCLCIGQSAIVAETGGFEGEVPATLKSIIGKVSQRDCLPWQPTTM